MRSTRNGVSKSWLNQPGRSTGSVLLAVAISPDGGSADTGLSAAGTSPSQPTSVRQPGAGKRPSQPKRCGPRPSGVQRISPRSEATTRFCAGKV